MRTLAAAFIVSVGMMLLQTDQHQATAADSTKDETQTELKKLQGLWQTSPGGMWHEDGSQVVANPVLEGPFFFLREDRLIWLDDEGKPTGKEEKIMLDVKVDPKRITRTPVGGDKDDVPSHGIYSATDSGLTVHIGLEGQPAPKQFLELNNPIKGVDGQEWLVYRKKLQEK